MEYVYDNKGNTIKIIAPDNYVISMVYDALSRLIKIIYPDNTTVEYLYDKTGNISAKNDANGNHLIYKYNARNELIEICKVTDKTQTIVKNSYDNQGNLIQREDTACKRFFTYNQLNLLIKEEIIISISNEYTNILLNSGLPYVFEYEYDDIMNLIKIKYPSGNIVEYGYQKNRMQNVIFNNQEIVNYTYDVLHNVIQKQFCNNIKTIYEYNELNQIKLYIEGDRWNPLIKESYQYDGVGNRTMMIDKNNNKTYYAYDKLNRLKGIDYNYQGGTPVFDISYNYDIFGNREYMKYAFGEIEYFYGNSMKRLNRYVINGTAEVLYNYDNNGNTIEQVRTDAIGNSKITGYKYDYKNRLMMVSNENFQMLCAYDSEDRRIMKIIKDDALFYLYNGNDVMAEIDKNGKIKSEYIYGIGRVCRVDYDGSGNITQKVYYHTDERGSVRLITDEAGNVIKEYEYDPFGSINYSQGIDRNRYRFCGKEYDDSTELYYFGARYYDPLLGRFTTEDPVVEFNELKRLNLYTYCGNNPIIYIDPDGRFFFSLILPGIGTVIDAMCWGALLGGGFSGVVYAITTEDFQWDEFWTCVGIGALSGAITGGVGSLISQPISAAIGGLAGDIVSGAVMGAVGGVSTIFFSSINFRTGMET